MRRILMISVSVLLLQFLHGCRPTVSKPGESNIIPRGEMIRIMSDVEITEAALRFMQSKVSRDSLEVITEKSFDSLYIFYGITPAQFKENLIYYQQDLKNFEKMIDEVMLIITKSKDSVQNLTVNPSDSLEVE
ncbi:MAG: DUF4296 domain-containing protein [Lentimicrobium sp.]|nr:DUF4296 domain-containing protein [Lentimicrobium sp.]